MSTVKYAAIAAFIIASGAGVISVQGASPASPDARPSNGAPDAIGSEEPTGPSGPTIRSVAVAPYSGVVPAGLLLRVPITGVIPGAVSIAPKIENPLANDPNAVARGMRDFDAFNCSGCHAANGAGGMGPALSNSTWIYRSTPANIYLTILQGRPAGMPAFGAMLPDRTIWELVAYIDSIAHDPNPTYGTTISGPGGLPAIEQVPANRVATADPWRYTEEFHGGKKSGEYPETLVKCANSSAEDTCANAIPASSQ